MNLKKYFAKMPYGSKAPFAQKLGITPTWLGLLISKKRQPSAELAKRIEKMTKCEVLARELRPDLFK